MRLDKLGMVNRLASEHGRLTAIIKDPRLGVTINGTYQGEAIVALVTPVVLGEFRAQLRRIEADLKQLGVVLS